MQCPITGKPCSHKRIINVTDIQDGKAVSEIELCKVCGLDFLKEHHPECQEETKEEVPVKEINTPQEFLKMLKAEKKTKIKMLRKCPQCGLTARQFNKTLIFGCPQCYDYFFDELESLVGKIDDKNCHVGKIPRTPIDKITLEDKIKTLKLKLTRAVEHEQYEVANLLKAEIAGLQETKADG